MRLKPQEVRIVNAVRSIRSGQVRVIKDEAGKVEVETNGRLQGAPVQQSSDQGSRPLRLRD